MKYDSMHGLMEVPHKTIGYLVSILCQTHLGSCTALPHLLYQKCRLEKVIQSVDKIIMELEKVGQSPGTDRLPYLTTVFKSAEQCKWNRVKFTLKAQNRLCVMLPISSGFNDEIGNL